MKKVFWGIVAVVCGVVMNFSGSLAQAEEAQTKTGQGALLGGLLGAVAGGVIGHQSDKGTEGALIGGAVGALGGAVVGSQMKSESATPGAIEAAASQDAQPVAAVEVPAKVTMKQIIYWTEQGLPSDEIIARIQKSNVVFVLTADDVDYLQQQKVSERVIEAMQETEVFSK